MVSWEIRNTKEKNEEERGGRGVFATQPIKQGDVVFVEQATVALPFPCPPSVPLSSRYCTRCFWSSSSCPTGTKKKMMRCSKCKFVVYCSRTCQKEDWDLYHKYECKTHHIWTKLNENSNSNSNDNNNSSLCDLLLMFRLCLLLWRKKEREKEREKEKTQQTEEETKKQQGPSPFPPLLSSPPIPPTPPPSPSFFFSLEGHPSQHPPPHLSLFSSLSSLVFKMGGKIPQFVDFLSNIPTFSEFSTFGEEGGGKGEWGGIVGGFCRFKSNNFTVYNSEMFEEGRGIFLNLSMINHSCDPNCVLMYRGGCVYVKALREIKEGEEITHSYVDMGAPLSLRSSLLSSSYFFSCSCPRCCGSLPSLVGGEVREKGEWEGKEGGNLSQLTSSLSSFLASSQAPPLPSSSSSSPSLSHLLSLKSHLTTTYETTSPSLPLLLSFLSLLSSLLSLLPPTHTHILSTLNPALSLSLSVAPLSSSPSSLLSLASSLCVGVLSLYSHVYPLVHPLVPLQLLTLGKIYWNNYETEKSYFVLIGGLKLMKTTVPDEKNDHVIHEFNRLLADIRKELGGEKEERELKKRKKEVLESLGPELGFLFDWV